MPNPGESTTGLPPVATLTEVLGHLDGSTSRQAIADLAAQLAARPELAALNDALEARVATTEGEIADLEAATAYASILTATWTDLLTITGDGDGQRAEVSDADTGTHGAASGTGYDGSTVNNAGSYSWHSTWSRWVRIGGTGLAGKADAADAVLTGDATAENLAVSGALSVGGKPVAVDVATALDDLPSYVGDDGLQKLPVLRWLPGAATIWLNGRYVALADVSTDNGDGTYDLTEMPVIPNGLTALFGWSREGHTGTPSGWLWSMNTSKSTLAGGVEANVKHYSGLDLAGFTAQNRVTSSVSTADFARYGETRGIMAVGASGNARYLIEGGAITQGGASVSYVQPTNFTIGKRAQTGATAPANIELSELTVWAGQASDAELARLVAAVDPLPAPAVQVYPSWLAVVEGDDGAPKVPACQVDRARGRYWFKGKERAFTDFAEALTGDAWRLKKGVPGLTTTSGITTVFDVMPDEFYSHAARPDGYFFHSSLSTGNPAGLQERNECRVYAQGDTTDPGGLIYNSAYNSKLNDFFPIASGATPAGVAALGGTRGQGVLRWGWSVPAAGSIRTLSDARNVGATSGTVSAFVPQDYFLFGRNFDGTAPLENCTLDQVILYAESLSAAELQRVAEFNEYGLPAFFFEGDSINNMAQPMEAFRLHAARAGLSYIPCWSGGLGGRGLSFHKEYITAWLDAYDHIRDHVLVLVEGGFDYSSLGLDGVTTTGPYSVRDVIGFLGDIREGFRQPHWVYMEANSNQIAEADNTAGNTNGMDALNGFMSAIRDTWPGAWCPTMDRMRAPAETDGEYDAIRIDGRMATHLRGDGIHFPWGAGFSSDPADASGYYFWSLALVDHLAGRGLLPARP